MEYLSDEELAQLEHLEEQEDGICYEGDYGGVVSLSTWQRLVAEVIRSRARAAEDRSYHGCR